MQLQSKSRVFSAAQQRRPTASVAVRCALPALSLGHRLPQLTARNPASVSSARPPVSRMPLRVKAIAADASGGSSDKAIHKEGGMLDTAVLGCMFGAWYATNIYFNLYNKVVLKSFPFPLTCTTIQFMVGAMLALTFWTTGLVKRPQVNGKVILSILPLAVVHTLGNLLTNVSLGSVAVSFTHTIKAMEPAFSVVLSALFLGDVPNPWVIASLVPVMGGVMLASMSEASFNWVGFASAMGSNLTFQSRNVLSKKLMKGQAKKAGEAEQEAPGIDNINLFQIITILSFLLLMPINLMVEGWKMSPAGLAALGVANPNVVMQKAVMAGLCFHLYQQISYMILQRVSPVTHSIGNCVKRVIVIVASVVVFRNPMSFQNALGTGIALLGVFAYSQAKRLTSKKPKSA